LKIKRAKEVEVEALDIEGKEIKLKAEGFLARVFQHEIDHLDGKLFFDRLSFIKRIKFKLKHPLI
jgi:peptide deformylase